MGLKSIEIKNLSAGRGCLAKAKADEPVFILRAQDALMPNLVDEWAQRLEAQSVNDSADPEKNQKRARKIAEARGLARQARQWQAINGAKLPD